MDRDSIQVPDSAWEIARQRFDVLEPLLKLKEIPAARAQAACQRLQISRRTLFRLVKRYKDSGGDLKELTRHNSLGGTGKGRLAQAIEVIITKAIDKVFLTKQRQNIEAVVKEVRKRCAEAGLKPPGKNTIRRRIDLLIKQDVAKKRLGNSAAHTFSPDNGPYLTAKYPHQAIMMDHTMVDIIVVDDFQRLPIGRPWLTVAIDIFSRCIAGIYLTLEAPSATSVGLCLTHAVFSKNHYLKALGIDGSWPIEGKPESLYVDQGPEFKSEALRRGCEHNGIGMFWRRKGAPHLHGIIERLIGTLMTKVHSLPGTTFSNPMERGEYDSEAHAFLTLSELEKWLVLIIVGQYHLEIHAGIMEPPIAKYKSGLELMPKPPITITSEKSFLIDFLPVLRRSIQRQGFIIDRIQYFSNALLPWIADRNSDKRFIIRRDPRDLSRIYALHPDERSYIEVPYRNLGRPLITYPQQSWGSDRAGAARSG
jgi:putative transposase